MTCDMCDSGGELFKVVVEGAEMTVCNNCAKYGKIVSKVQKPKPVSKKEPKSIPITKRPEIITMVKRNYSKLIKEKRERKGLKQEEMAKMIAEKVSVIHQLETGHIEPSIDLARKIEKFLKIKLIEEYEEKGGATKGSSKEMTIGDMIKIK